MHQVREINEDNQQICCKAVVAALESTCHVHHCPLHSCRRLVITAYKERRNIYLYIILYLLPSFKEKLRQQEEKCSSDVEDEIER